MCIGCFLLSDLCTLLSQSCFNHVSLVDLAQPMSAQILKLMSASYFFQHWSPDVAWSVDKVSNLKYYFQLYCLKLRFSDQVLSKDRLNVSSYTFYLLFDQRLSIAIFSSIYNIALQTILLLLELDVINMYSSIKKTLKRKFVELIYIFGF